MTQQLEDVLILKRIKLDLYGCREGMQYNVVVQGERNE